MERYCRNCLNWEATMSGRGICLELGEFLRTESSIFARKIDDVQTSQFGSCLRFTPSSQAQAEADYELERNERDSLGHLMRRDLDDAAAAPTGTDA